MATAISAAIGRNARIGADHSGVHHRRIAGALALYLPVAIAVRLLMFGQPAFQSDEQFYLLVGQRMAQGALPYVDIWDRKPWGLFAIYRAVWALPVDPVLGYQALGLGCSVLTALAIAHMARWIAPPPAARMAGIVYLLWQPVFNVALGQSPVFYNLPVALAALIVIAAQTRAHDPRLTRRGAAAMLLLGIAMQIKYTVVFEGIALGLMLLVRGRNDGWSRSRLALTGGAWITLAIAPTAAVLVGYELAGHGEAFIQANFLSIMGRATDIADAFTRLGKEALALIPFALALLLAPARLHPVTGERAAALPALRIWALAALAGFLAFGTWYDHYLGPLLVPFSALCAPVLARRRREERWYGRLLIGIGLVGAIAVPAVQRLEKGDAAQFSSASRLIARELGGRCLYVFEGDSALYRTTDACIPTRFAYPSHLDSAAESRAIGIDPVAEVRRILATRPGVVVTARTARPDHANLDTRQVVIAVLKARYERFAAVTLGSRKFDLWRTKEPPKRPSPHG
ncbi:glycosyltransferase family 39 protein [Novosphingobium resinovorum]|uniref:glycosyltransferase family 39 protein n=1 Tax=Novosphingobium resinovorum TaxID=158500 RepID=UPI002ED121E8|nr:glycosyltransferase family 39 protein [Novosphingobium resinovorum]